MAVDQPFVYARPATRIVFGQGCVARLQDEVGLLGGTRAMLVHGPVMEKMGLVERVIKGLGSTYAGSFSEVEPHAPIKTVEKGAARATELEADVLVSLGGGSTIDTAKGIALALAEGSIMDYAIRFDPPDNVRTKEAARPKTPHIAIPTTASGTEMTGVIGITEGGIKWLFNDIKLRPHPVVVDPDLVRDTPAFLTATSGMSAMSHAVEGLMSPRSTPIAEAIGTQVIQMLLEFIPRLLEKPDDLYAWGRYQVASIMWALSAGGGGGLHHAVGHCLGGRCGVPHGVAHSITLPHVMRFNRVEAASGLAVVARAMGVDVRGKTGPEVSDAAAEAMLAFTGRIGVPQRLRDAGIREEDLPQIAEDTMHDRGITGSPRPITSASQVLEVLRWAW